MVNMSLSGLKLVRHQGRACLVFRVLSISVLSHPQRTVGSWVDNLAIQREDGFLLYVSGFFF